MMQVKYDLSDWEKRRRGLAPLVEDAVRAGLVTGDKSAPLIEFLVSRGAALGERPQPLLAAGEAGGVDTLVAAEPSVGLEESEAPRFIRGFHDVLITIGLVIGLTGLGGLWSLLAVIPAVIALSEILVLRQRLALPAVALTLAFAGASSFAVASLLEGKLGDWEWVAMSFAPFLMLSIYYWRYRAPISLALAAISGFAAIVFFIGAALMHWTGNDLLFVSQPWLISALIGLFALASFATALHFDLSDRARVTRRSDVAFWLHLAAAPALLYTVISLVFLRDPNASWFADSTTLGQATAIVAAVAALMLTGILLDRRAFVTSGLLSFGYAFKILLDEGGVSGLFASSETLIFVILSAVGAVVLSLGIGWKALRTRLLAILPIAVRDRLPLSL
jgi:hypothetical protein